MKRLILPLLLLFGILTASSCFTKSLTPKYLKGSWYVFEDPSVRYIFSNDTIMYIDDACEGEAYEYMIKGDTIIYHPIGEDSTNNQRLYLDVSGSNTMFASDGKIGFILRREEK